MSAKDAQLQKSGSHYIRDDVSSQCADGIGKEEVFLYCSAKWRGKPVIVTMHADRYAASHWDEATGKSTNRLVDWRVYAQEARYLDEDRNGGRGESVTGTARSALSKLCQPLVTDWLASEAYSASFQRALGDLVMRKFQDNYSAANRVSEALATFRARLAPEVFEAIRETLDVYNAFEATKARAFDVIAKPRASKLEAWEEEARKLGTEHARNAASWIEADGDSARDLLDKLADGDPEVYDRLPRQPNLSGEYADDLTPLSLARDVTGEEETDAETQDALATAYEEGVSDAFEDACVSELRKLWTSDMAREYELASSGIEEEGDARFIASLWHGGQSSALYAFSSSGYVDKDALESEIERALPTYPAQVMSSDTSRDALRALLAYVRSL